MAKQTPESNEPNKSPFERATSLYRKHETTIHAIGAVAGVAGAVAGAVLTILNKQQQYTPEEIAPDELAKPEETEKTEKKPTTALCKDGTTTDAGGKQGACAYHGGLAT
ncbi:hypothetical protein ACWEAF_20050 [Streptomyces sp. NPDC005071]